MTIRPHRHSAMRLASTPYWRFSSSLCCFSLLTTPCTPLGSERRFIQAQNPPRRLQPFHSAPGPAPLALHGLYCDRHTLLEEEHFLLCPSSSRFVAPIPRSATRRSQSEVAPSSSPDSNVEDHPSTGASARKQSQFNRRIHRVSESLFVPPELRSQTLLSSDFARVVPGPAGGASVNKYEHNDPDPSFDLSSHLPR